jgi:hypothetical protein
MALGVLMISSLALPVLAEDSMTTSATGTPMTRHEIQDKLKGEREKLMGERKAQLAQLGETARVCLAAAVDKREAAVGAAFAAFSTSMTSALSTRRTALAAAWALTDAAARNAATKAAWQAWNTAAKSARQTLNAARRTAWSTFSTDRKACRPSTSIGVEAHESSSVDSSL